MTMFEPLKRFFAALQSLFLTGLLTIIPLAATVFFIHFLYGFVSRSLTPIYNLEPPFLRAIPGAHFVIFLMLMLTLGVILNVLLVHRIVHYAEGLIARIPLVRIVYSSAKIMVNFFKVPETPHDVLNRKVVLIPYPQKGQYHLAFLLESAEDSYEKIIADDHRNYPGERYVKVFMPHSPNPTSGFFFIMPKEQIISTDISFEEAIKTLVSCGLITPESLKTLPRQ